MTENKQLIAQANEALFDTFANQYTAICQTIFRLPMNEDMRRIVREHFDTGFLWVKEAAQLSKMQAQQVPELLEVEDGA